MKSIRWPYYSPTTSLPNPVHLQTPVSGGPAATATARYDMSSEINSLDSDLNLCYENQNCGAGLFFVLTTLLFLDFTGTLHAWFGWMAKIQFLPALLALNVGVVAFLVILTLLFGRVYCSVICPLGVMQDIVSWASGKRRKHRNRFAYSPALTWLRRGMLVVFVAAMLAGVGFAARALQRLRPHRLEPAGPGLRVGATTCWHTSPGAWTATPSIRSTSG